MMASLQPLWWLALPVLLLPLWWHMRRRERTKVELLATARFLPPTTPQQQRTPRWQDLLLLLLRMLLLLALIAWLAVTVMPWRGDTVIAPAGIEADAAAREAAAASIANASLQTVDAAPLDWIASHQHEFRKGARIVLLARGLPMPAHVPQFSLPLQVRLLPAAAPAAPRRHHIALASTAERDPQWRAMFKAFAAAGEQFDIADVPKADTDLIVWDRDETPPPAWKAPLWWRSGAAPAGAMALDVNGIRLAIADTAHGRVWTSADWPTDDGTGVRAVYETWRQLAAPPVPYPMPAGAFPAGPPAVAAAADPRPSDWLAWSLAVLFIVERIGAHVRRR